MKNHTKRQIVRIPSELQRGPLSIVKSNPPKKHSYQVPGKRKRILYGYAAENESEQFVIGTRSQDSRYRYTGSAVLVLHQLCSMAQKQKAPRLVFSSLYEANKLLDRPNTGRSIEELNRILELWSKTKLVVINKKTGKCKQLISATFKKYKWQRDGSFAIDINQCLVYQSAKKFTKIDMSMIYSLQNSPCSQNLYRFLIGWSLTASIFYERIDRLSKIVGLNTNNPREIRRHINKAVDKINHYHDQTGYLYSVDWIKNKDLAKFKVYEIPIR